MKKQRRIAIKLDPKEKDLLLKLVASVDDEDGETISKFGIENMMSDNLTPEQKDTLLSVVRYNDNDDGCRGEYLDLDKVSSFLGDDIKLTLSERKELKKDLLRFYANYDDCKDINSLNLFKGLCKKLDSKETKRDIE
jgi:hypothetical protein